MVITWSGLYDGCDSTSHPSSRSFSHGTQHLSIGQFCASTMFVHHYVKGVMSNRWHFFLYANFVHAVCCIYSASVDSLSGWCLRWTVVIECSTVYIIRSIEKFCSIVNDFGGKTIAMLLIGFYEPILQTYIEQNGAFLLPLTDHCNHFCNDFPDNLTISNNKTLRTLLYKVDLTWVQLVLRSKWLRIISLDINR